MGQAVQQESISQSKSQTWCDDVRGYPNSDNDT